MKGIEITVGQYPPKDVAFTGLIATNRQAVLDLLDATPNHYFEITMPCGYSVRFDKHKDIPYNDVQCHCGGFERYLIRYKGQ